MLNKYEIWSCIWMYFVSILKIWLNVRGCLIHKSTLIRFFWTIMNEVSIHFSFKMCYFQLWFFYKNDLQTSFYTNTGENCENWRLIKLDKQRYLSHIDQKMVLRVLFCKSSLMWTEYKETRHLDLMFSRTCNIT